MHNLSFSTTPALGASATGDTTGPQVGQEGPAANEQNPGHSGFPFRPTDHATAWLGDRTPARPRRPYAATGLDTLEQTPRRGHPTPHPPCPWATGSLTGSHQATASPREAMPAASGQARPIAPAPRPLPEKRARSSIRCAPPRIPRNHHPGQHPPRRTQAIPGDKETPHPSAGESRSRRRCPCPRPELRRPAGMITTARINPQPAHPTRYEYAPTRKQAIATQRTLHPSAQHASPCRLLAQSPSFASAEPTRLRTSRCNFQNGARRGSANGQRSRPCQGAEP
jgi:hypothetical protein